MVWSSAYAIVANCDGQIETAAAATATATATATVLGMASEVHAAAGFAGPEGRPAAIGPHCLSIAFEGGVQVQEGPAGCESVRPGASACVPGVGVKGHRRRHEWMRRVR